MTWLKRSGAGRGGRRALPLAAALLLLGGGAASASGGTDPVSRVLGLVVLVLVAGKLGAALFESLGQPGVVGELLAGIVLGNLSMAGVASFGFLRSDLVLRVLAEIGVLLLLFEVGLETRLEEMKKVGGSSFLVALVGVVAPFLLAVGVTRVFQPEAPIQADLFVAAVLCATSVGITARLLQDLGMLQRAEARIILGAAVIDDVLGLIVLAVVSGMVDGASTGRGGLALSSVAWVVLKSGGFFVLAIALGVRVSPGLFRVASRLKAGGVLLTAALGVCFALAWLAGRIGLAPIVGAFAAGLVMEEVHYKEFRDRGERRLEELIRPLTVFLAPIFFVRMGALVDLRVFARPEVLGFAGALTAAAVLGKQVCSLAVLERGLNRLAIGIGMIPRGEVGLIVAGIGASLRIGGRPVVGPDAYAAVVAMVAATTFLMPPALQWALRRR